MKKGRSRYYRVSPWMIIGSDQTKDHKPKAQPNNQNTKIVLGKGEMKVW